MVDESLIKDLRTLREKGASAPSDILKIFELAKQMSGEVEDMKEEIEDMDTIFVQFHMKDVDYKWWVKMGEGVFEYGEAETAEPNVTLATSQENMAAMFSGEADSTSLYMSGELMIEGNLQDAMAFGEVMGLMQEELEDLDI